MGDVIMDWMENPENMTRVYLAINVGMIVSNILIAGGALVFVLKILEFF